MKSSIKKVSNFDITDLLPIGLTMVVFGIAIAYGLNVQGDIRDEFAPSACTATGFTYNASNMRCENSSGGIYVPDSAEYNASLEAINGVSKLPEKLPLIATVIIAAVIIGILIRYLMVRFG